MSVAKEEQTVSRALANFIVNARIEHLDELSVQQSRYALLDGLGVSIAATTLGEGVGTFIEWVREQQAQGPCAVMAQDFSTSASLAAFANGALAHALDFEDAHDKALVHPNAAVIPAALAIAQTRDHVSGQTLITAIAVGCEITCRLGVAIAAHLDQYSWYPPPILSAYGATAAAAKLLKLDQQQILDAFSLTLSQATCSAEIKHNSHSQIRAVRDAFPAQTGVVSAQLAQRGLRGFAQPLEGKDGFFAGFARNDYDSAVLTEQLGKQFAIRDLSFKPWPSCRGTHPPLELMLNLGKQHNLNSGDIKSITVYGNALNCMLAEPIEDKRQPKSAIDAKFSIPYCLACAVVDGEVNLDSFAPQALTRPELVAVARKVNYLVDRDFTSPLMTRVEVLLADGRTIEARTDGALGSPERPLTEIQLREKFMHCLSHSPKPLHRQQGKKFAETVLSIDVNESVGQLLQFI